MTIHGSPAMHAMCGAAISARRNAPQTDAAASEFAGRALGARALSAVSRRVRRWWRGEERIDAIPAALDWLERRVVAGDHDASKPRFRGAALAAASLKTFEAFGRSAAGQHALDRVLAAQLADGSFQAAGGSASLFDSGMAVAGWLAMAQPPRRAAPAMLAACEFLASRVDASGRIRHVAESAAAVERFAPTAAHLAWLAALRRAARVWREERFEDAACRAIRRLRRTADLTAWDVSSGLLAHRAAALADLSEFEPAMMRLALDVARLAATAQRRDGSLPSEPRGAQCSAQGAAHFGCIWYAVGERHAADRALAWLRRAQARDGGLPRETRLRSRAAARGESPWAVKYFLDAARAQVAAAFAEDGHRLPRAIDPADARLAAVVRALSDLPRGARVADVGCGAGRYLKRLAYSHAHLRLVGIDPSAALLAELPPHIEARRGGLLNVPAADGEFDAALAIESLEHALDAERAVAELTRIVRPGGRILIIDKDRRFQPLSECHAWERWFTREEVSAWLSHTCDTIDVESLDVSPSRAVQVQCDSISISPIDMATSQDTRRRRSSSARSPYLAWSACRRQAVAKPRLVA